MLGFVHRRLAAHPIGKTGQSRKRVRTGAAIPIRRFGGALNPDVRLRVPVLDGVCVERSDGTPRLRWLGAPTTAEFEAPTRTLARRIGRSLRPLRLPYRALLEIRR